MLLELRALEEGPVKRHYRLIDTLLAGTAIRCVRYRPYWLSFRNRNHVSIELSLIGSIVSLAISTAGLMWLVATSRGFSFIPSKAIASSLFLCCMDTACLIVRPLS